MAGYGRRAKKSGMQSLGGGNPYGEETLKKILNDEVLSPQEEQLVLNGIVEGEFTRIQKILATDPNITPSEAAGLASYIGEKYQTMNAFLYAKEIRLGTDGKTIADAIAAQNLRQSDLDYYQAANRGAAKALSKLDKASVSAIQDRYPGYDPKQGLFRYVKSLEGNLSDYQPGRVLSFKGFTSTTINNALNPSKSPKANKDGTKITNAFGDRKYIFRIKPKANTKGVLVDRFKNVLDEGEVLYAPGQKFRINKVQQVGKKTVIYLNEI